VTIYDYIVKTIDGQPQPLDAYRGQVLLIVNVASKCGFTPQYAGLEGLYQRYHSKGLTVLGFPCDQFLHQELDDEAAIKQFCTLHYQVTFPMFAKIQVNGPETHPLYNHLKSARPGWLGSKSIKWNFTKFLINKDGSVLQRYAPITKPERIEKAIVPLLT
jgi:glutathione peroxidase